MIDPDPEYHDSILCIWWALLLAVGAGLVIYYSR